MADSPTSESTEAFNQALDTFVDKYFGTPGVVSVQDSEDGELRITVEVRPNMLKTLRAALPTVWHGFRVVIAPHVGYLPQTAG